MKNKKKFKDKDNFKSLFNNTNNKLNIFVIKTSLKSILKDYDKNFIFINNLVKDTNECVIQTYQFIRLYFLYCFYNNIEFVQINTENILYFMRALGTRDSRGKQPENIDLQNKLNDFYNNEFYPLINKPKFNFTHKTQLNAYIAEHISTAFNNNIKEHFITRFKRFLNIFEPDILFETDKKNKEFIKEKKRIYNLVKNSILNYDIEKSCPEEFKDFAYNIRNEYLPLDYDKSFYYDCKKENNIPYYLKQTIKMNNKIENYNNNIDKQILNTNDEKKKKEYITMKKKLFQVIPLRISNIPSYVCFDKTIRYLE